LQTEHLPSLNDVRLPPLFRYPLIGAAGIRVAMGIWYAIMIVGCGSSLLSYTYLDQPFLHHVFSICEWVLVAWSFFCVFLLFSSIPPELASTQGPDPSRLTAVKWYNRREARVMVRLSSCTPL
jgi:hypothetical protein